MHPPSFAEFINNYESVNKVDVNNIVLFFSVPTAHTVCWKPLTYMSLNMFFAHCVNDNKIELNYCTGSRTQDKANVFTPR